ncbi:MAG: hypothetical protein M1839_006449 [Geoglossum umbratile]|nr:MAG: hypothetical protein M1839_006449 [Geoglossum umbratile]
MSQNSSKPNRGTLGVNTTLTTPALPAIVSEWAALIPLVIHLASRRDDHRIAGEAALMGGLSVGLFPRLGTLDGISRLLYGGPNFLDRASAMGDLGSVVWDVNWGSTFPCANGAASAMIRSIIQRSKKPTIGIPEHVQPDRPLFQGRVQTSDVHGTEKRGDSQLNKALRSGNPYGPTGFRRYQTLHVFKFSRETVKLPWRHRVLFLPPLWLTGAASFIQTGVAVVLVLSGIYGTAAVILTVAISQLTCHFLQLQRPPLYLNNNETHDACMLAATHENSSTWWLYIGDRGVVDSLLNKPMISLPPSSSKRLSYWFRIAHVIQLLSMTYVAAQKGWDGICMLILIIAAYLCHWPYRDHHIGQLWLDQEGITAETKSFRFGGRTQMIGAIHAFSGTKVTTWMDAIIAPSPRRQAWLRRLSGIDTSQEVNDLEPSDRSWVVLHSDLAMEATRVLQREMNGLASTGEVSSWGSAPQPAGPGNVVSRVSADKGKGGDQVSTRKA